MNVREITFIKEKNNKLQEFIVSQHRLPKAQRDQRALSAAKEKSDRYVKWIKEK